MKAFERILIKIIVIQFIFLIISQLMIHQFDLFPELKEITQYEGVTDNYFTKLLEAFSGI